MRAGIMSMLVVEVVRDLMATAGLRFAMYNLHSSGLEGLRFFKEQMGFQPHDVTWTMGDGTDEELRAARARAVEAALSAAAEVRQTGDRAGPDALLRRLAHHLARLISRGASGRTRS
jgi:hypothetical protein